MRLGSDHVRVRVPATSANLGPGFDSMGIALAHYDTIEIRALGSPEVTVEVFGEGDAHRVEARTEVGARRGHPHSHVVAAQPHRGVSSQPSPSASAIDTTSGVTRTSSTGEPSSPRKAHCGSLRPWPVTVTVILAPAGTRPASASISRPATPAADAGSTKMPTRADSNRWAARIWVSVTASISPPDSSRAATACCQEAGLPIRIAVAMVSGSSTGWPSTIGAAPAAWKPHIIGACVAGPSVAYSVKPIQYAVMFPALPTGRTCTSGASPSTPLTGRAAVFCPWIRSGLTEFTSSTG